MPRRHTLHCCGCIHFMSSSYIEGMVARGAVTHLKHDIGLRSCCDRPIWWWKMSPPLYHRWIFFLTTQKPWWYYGDAQCHIWTCRCAVMWPPISPLLCWKPCFRSTLVGYQGIRTCVSTQTSPWRCSHAFLPCLVHFSNATLYYSTTMLQLYLLHTDCRYILQASDITLSSKIAHLYKRQSVQWTSSDNSPLWLRLVDVPKSAGWFLRPFFGVIYCGLLPLVLGCWYHDTRRVPTLCSYSKWCEFILVSFVCRPCQVFFCSVQSKGIVATGTSDMKPL